jgi:hypothetical protein
MRQGQQNNKRMRGRNRKGPNPLTRSYESNGGDVKIRGTAIHIAEKYVQLARDAQSSGDRVAAENYLQHAEHYYRILAAAQAQMPQPQPVFRSDEDGDEEEGVENRGNGYGAPQQPAAAGGETQPYVNGGATEGDEESDQGGDNRFEPRDIPMLRESVYSNRPYENRGPNDQGGGYNNNNRGQHEHGGYRGRRRRPFRDRHQDQRDGGNENPPAPMDPEPRGDS